MSVSSYNIQYLPSLRLGVQSVLIDMQKALERGEVPEEELRALESDVTGKVISSPTLW